MTVIRPNNPEAFGLDKTASKAREAVAAEAKRRNTAYQKAKEELAARRLATARCSYHEQHDPSCTGCKATLRRMEGPAR